MKWILVNRIHINTDKVQSFHWIEGRLFIRFGGNESVTFRDPEREKYLRLCGQLGVRPVEDDEDGQE